ncbi:hypothetical protein [Melghirimyces algeriensis]|uniref:Uncharacterized protein n=1 Tax=Melghirimyces algeriensis TaxID=910412 RepID=A0A521F2C6_9BACL|nr:hypothetical protein [Melghirimyces algeriensis]SMO90342.1 hypothetical protein SAMN06264849_11255 [Melghirimyces algeriensis]
MEHPFPTIQRRGKRNYSLLEKRSGDGNCPHEPRNGTTVPSYFLSEESEIVEIIVIPLYEA